MSANSILVDVGADGEAYKLTVDAGKLGRFEADSPYQFNEYGRLNEVLRGIEIGRCKLDDFRDIGSELYDSVFSGKTSKLLKELYSSIATDEIALLRLSLPRELQQLPWEALYNEQYSGFVSTHPNYCIVRETLDAEPYEGIPLKQMPITQLPLRMLVVIPEGSGLNVEQEWHNLQHVCDRYPKNIKPERLDGRVTPERLAAQLQRKVFNIVHFIGHGEVTGEDTFTIRMNDPRRRDELWMDAETFASLFYAHPPQLVVLNCCLGAAASPKRTLTGIAPALLRSGVPAVVAMRYEIADDIATEFTSKFYSELLGGNRPGRVDSAISCARQLIYQNKNEGTVRGFITPVLYLKRAQRHLFDIARASEVEDKEHSDGSVTEAIPEALQMCLEKLRLRDCVVIVGPGILCSGLLVRSGKQPPTVRELAERLAVECSYPWSSEYNNGKNTHEWLAGLLLPWVCQHYQKVKRRYALIKAIEDAYTGVDPPPVFKALARLGVPGIIYPHFDGLMEKAFLERNTPVQTIAAVDQRFESDIGGTVLICAKGTLRLKDSLVLTEEDHEKLHDRIAQLSPVLRDRMRGQVGRSVLFVGVSPRDELVRRIAAQVLEAGDNRTQGPTFFICGYQSTGDDAYWGKYDVRWISYDIDQLAEVIRRELQ